MSHNSAGSDQDLPFKLSGSQKKTAFALRKNAEQMIAESGVERCVFVTFTLGERREDGTWKKVYDGAEASRRWNNLNRRFVGEFFERLIIVTERHKDGGIHFHALGILRPEFGDVRAGFDWSEVRRGNYASVPRPLLHLWARFREELPSFGFGRAEAMPIEKTGEAVAAYVSKYVEKNLFNRHGGDRGKRLVRYVGFDRHLKANDFSWATKRAAAWRTNAARLSSLVGVRDRGEVGEAFGPRWAFRLSGVMNAIAKDDRHCVVMPTFPERATAQSLVARVARPGWVRRRESANTANVALFRWQFRTRAERAQLTFEERSGAMQTTTNSL